MKSTVILEPYYLVKYAESDDGICWRRTGVVCIDYDPFTRAIGRPWVVRLGDRYGMWFSYRGVAATIEPIRPRAIGLDTLNPPMGSPGSGCPTPRGWSVPPMGGIR